MQLKIQTTSGAEVNWAGHVRSARVYGGEPDAETGVWKLSMPKIADYLCAELAGCSCGESIDTFVLGFEIAALNDWGTYFTSMAQYMSYRPKMKLLLSVGQLNWPDVKDMSAEEQFAHFSRTLLDAIDRTGSMKRKPKSFDAAKFSSLVTQRLEKCPVTMIAA